MFESRNLGVKIENDFVGILAFADDIAMVANNYEQAQNMLLTLETLLNRYQLELNIRKTQFIASYNGQLSYKGEPIQRTQHYKYLGKIIDVDLTHSKHIAN